MTQTLVGTTKSDKDGPTVHWERGTGMWQLMVAWAVAAMEHWI